MSKPSPRKRRFPRPPRRAIPTVPGIFALIAPTFLGLAAVTATNNLLFLLLGATLGAVVLSGILSERNLRPIRIRVMPVSPIYAEAPARLEVRFLRDEARGPAFDLRYREIPNGNFWPWARVQPGEVLDVHLPVMEDRTARCLGERRFARRGRVALHEAELATRFPFGLLIKSKDVDTDLEVLVRPRRVDRPPELARPPGVTGMGETAQHRGLGLDVYGLREREERDSEHRVHALRSLALGRPVVLEMTGTERPRAELGVATGPDADPESLERTLEYAQAALRAWDEEGFAVGLTTHSGSFAPGEVTLDGLLDHLAGLQPELSRGTARVPSSWLVPAGAAAPAGVATFHVALDGTLSEGAREQAA
ncbi:MAG: hypothetical protein AAFU79_12735 [Myxococcota bacterium]